MPKEVKCENCIYYRMKYIDRVDMEGSHPEKIYFCDLGYEIKLGGQPGCEGTGFVQKTTDKDNDDR